MDFPLVSCLCVVDENTHFLVDGLIFDFSNQDYPYKELIIVNNCISQAKNADLLIDATPNVFIYDTPQKCSRGLAKNYAIRQSNGQILANFYVEYRHATNRISSQVLALAEHNSQANVLSHIMVSTNKGAYVSGAVCLDTIVCLRPKDVDFNNSDYGYNKKFLLDLIKSNYNICSVDGKDLVTRQYQK